jgi:hypothetical protein
LNPKSFPASARKKDEPARSLSPLLMSVKWDVCVLRCPLGNFKVVPIFKKKYKHICINGGNFGFEGEYYELFGTCCTATCRQRINAMVLTPYDLFF